MTLAFHQYANLFPLIEGQDFYDIAEDIRVNGLHDKIDLVEADGGYQILDGRNRYRMLVWIMTTGEALGQGWQALAGAPLSPDRLSAFDSPVLFTVRDPAECDLLAYVLSKNLKRRHLDESQRAMVAARLPRKTHGGDRSKSPIGDLTLERRAELLNVGQRSVERAEMVQDHATPDLIEAVDRGAIAVSAAAELAAQPAERQAEILAALPRDETGKLTPEDKKALGPVIKEIRAEKVAAKRERRAEREETLGRKIQALPEKMFGVAIEDFEWHHSVWSRDTGCERHPGMHYETAEDALTPEQIVARCAERFACLADTCILFKWTTVPHLAVALKVLELQGFAYVTHLMWDKERVGAARGTGYWFTGEHEVVLVGARGKVVPPAFAHFPSRFRAPVGEHSEKPDNIHEIVEFHWPNTPKVEFNARRRRAGWEAWGFGAPAVSPEADFPQFDVFADVETPSAEAQKPASAGQDGPLPASIADPAYDLAAADPATDKGAGGDDHLHAPPAPIPATALAVDQHPLIPTGEMRIQKEHVNIMLHRHVLGAIAAGENVSGPVVDELRALKNITGGKRLKLTHAGKTRLEGLDEDFNRLMKLSAIPSSVDDLVGLYRTALERLNDHVLNIDEAGVQAELELLDLLQERANGNTIMGMACDDSPAERLRAETAAPIGAIPTWGQRGVFRLIIEDVPHLVTHDEHHSFGAHAEDPDKPFLSETGYRSLSAWDEPALGHSVSEQAEAFIREQIATYADHMGGKRLKRKGELPRPQRVYRLPLPGEGAEAVPIEPGEARTLAVTAPDNNAPSATDVPVESPKAVLAPPLPAVEHPLDIPEFLRRPLKQSEMDLTRRDHAPPEIVDNALQTRLPLTDDEIDLHAALTQVASGATVDWPVLRDLVGAGFVHATTENIVVTAEGLAFLAQLVPSRPTHEVRA